MDELHPDEDSVMKDDDMKDNVLKDNVMMDSVMKDSVIFGSADGTSREDHRRLARNGRRRNRSDATMQPAAKI